MPGLATATKPTSMRLRCSLGREAFADLIEASPEIAAAAALGERVIVLGPDGWITIVWPDVGGRRIGSTPEIEIKRAAGAHQRSGGPFRGHTSTVCKSCTDDAGSAAQRGPKDRR